MVDRNLSALDQVLSSISSLNAASGTSGGGAQDTSIASLNTAVTALGTIFGTDTSSVVTGLSNVVSRLNSLTTLLGAVSLVGTTNVVSGFSLIATGGAAAYYGFAITETASATARVNLRHGQGATAPLLAAVNLTAFGNDYKLSSKGVSIPNGIYVDVISGAVNLSVFSG